jgi:phage terminase small subunit
MDKLSFKQELFVNEYLISFNATDAAIKAGYSPKTAYRIGYENLHKPNIINRIRQYQNKTTEKLNVTRESIIQDLIDIKDGNKKKSPNVAIKAIELLSKMQGFDKPNDFDIVKEDTKINVEIIIPKEYKDESEGNQDI